MAPSNLIRLSRTDSLQPATKQQQQQQQPSAFAMMAANMEYMQQQQQQQHNGYTEPNKDTWLFVPDDPNGMDRNRLDSLRRVLLNPDVPRLNVFHCHCGREIHLRDSWYVMTLDGRLVCNACAICHCCGRSALASCRQLVCIDGMVLCYCCVKYYGYNKIPKLLDARKIVTIDKTVFVARDDEQEKQQGEKLNLKNAANSEYYEYNVPRTTRWCYSPRKDSRRLIRVRFYSSPVWRMLPLEDDPLEVPPAYLAENFRQPPAMLCPACDKIALGPVSYVVPQMARVYHRDCFKCYNCKASLTYGVHTAAVTFYYCSCEAPHLWCGRDKCREARYLHHKSASCHLGCIRPGGRPQFDDLTQPLNSDAHEKKEQEKQEFSDSGEGFKKMRERQQRKVIGSR